MRRGIGGVVPARGVRAEPRAGAGGAVHAAVLSMPHPASRAGVRKRSRARCLPLEQEVHHICKPCFLFSSMLGSVLLSFQ